jgi:hypothetical protein
MGGKQWTGRQPSPATRYCRRDSQISRDQDAARAAASPIYPKMRDVLWELVKCAYRLNPHWRFPAKLYMAQLASAFSRERDCPLRKQDQRSKVLLTLWFCGWFPHLINMQLPALVEEAKRLVPVPVPLGSQPRKPSRTAGPA